MIDGCPCAFCKSRSGGKFDFDSFIVYHVSSNPAFPIRVMGSTKENVSAGESTELKKKLNETAGELSVSDLVDSADLSVNISSVVSTPPVETNDQISSRNEATPPANSKKGKKKSRHSKKGHTPAKETADRNVVRRVHHTAAKFKQCRKRAQSFPTISKFFLPHKRPHKEAFIPPTKFLLGGNISDPLNLNSLKDENVNRAMNAVTPESSPLPTPPRHKAKIDVIIPPNIRDPLNLMEPLDNDEYEKRLEMQQRKPRKKARLRRKTTDNTSPSRLTEEDNVKELPPPEPSTAASKSRKRSCSDSDNASQKGKEVKKLRRIDSLDKIVSPVVPQPGAWKRARPQQRMSTSERPVSPHRTKLKSQSEEEKKLPKFHAKNSKYQFGNYDR